MAEEREGHKALGSVMCTAEYHSYLMYQPLHMPGSNDGLILHTIMLQHAQPPCLHPWPHPCLQPCLLLDMHD